MTTLLLQGSFQLEIFFADSRPTLSCIKDRQQALNITVASLPGTKYVRHPSRSARSLQRECRRDDDSSCLHALCCKHSGSL